MNHYSIIKMHVTKRIFFYLFSIEIIHVHCCARKENCDQFNSQQNFLEVRRCALIIKTKIYSCFCCALQRQKGIDALLNEHNVNFSFSKIF